MVVDVLGMVRVGVWGLRLAWVVGRMAIPQAAGEVWATCQH